MDETFDFIVVGSGGGSMCAALVMKSQGKSVLILEKTDLFGGTTAMSGGVMWIPNNPFMKPAGVEDSPDQAMRYLDNVVGDHDDTPGASRERRMTYVTEAPRMVEFLTAQGIKLRRIPYWPDYDDDRPGGSEAGRTVVAELFDASELGEWRTKLRPNFVELPGSLDEVMSLAHMKQTWIGKRNLVRIALRGVAAKLTGKHWVTAGNALQGRMFQAAIKAGVDMRANAAVKRLETGEDGGVTGVVAQIDGQERRFAARDGVLVNAGGFSRNQAMRDRYQPGTSVEWTNASPGDTGEMIQEMMRIGADIAQMEEMVGCQVTLTPENPEIHPMVQADVSSPHSIIVDQSGVRYMREAQSYMRWCQEVLERNKTVPAIPSWLVLDSQFMKKYMLSGSLPFGRKPPSWIESGFLKKADTLTGLAEICGMEPGKLEASVERFNGFVRKGRDEDFHRGERAYDRYLGDPTHKPSPSLGTVEQAPFYAVKIYPGDVGTYGGVVTDVNARVLRADGSPIPGLYATGISTASVMGRAYPGAGSSVGPSFVWGYVAAKHAAHAGNQMG
ncbi:FAD-dependent oxidoreductase [uncultured Sphingomonas sp.]|uniref:FAD-dependent oxidoreductase n=1 Tax=uncultured Sphingomonas sp. TaxID=158754 RepID=UPI0035CC084E